MKIRTLLRTVQYLRLRQLYYQLYYRIVKPKRRDCKAESKKLVLMPFIQKPKCNHQVMFSFLNVSSKFLSWDMDENGPLWRYNLNYMDWLLQSDMTFEEGAYWIDLFISSEAVNRSGFEPYPIALRGINWIKFISRHRDKIPKDKLQIWDNSLYSQYRVLTNRLEYHLLGNHLLEDAFSIFIASIYFDDNGFFSLAENLLKSQLKKQVLPDGAHFEQSPMYHCILLDRLLDCYNVSISGRRGSKVHDIDFLLKEYAERMLGHLESIIYRNSEIPLLNDSANGIAPDASELFEYANRLGLKWTLIELKECGYRKFVSRVFEGIVDVGNITASYQPGHSHADTFSYELRINSSPFVVDTGISTYDKNSRRQYERSTIAHNTVTIDGRDSSEVWGGFRVGKRAKVKLISESGSSVTAEHDGYGVKCKHRRCFSLKENSFIVKDWILGSQIAESHIHLAPGVKILSQSNNILDTDVAEIVFDGAIEVLCHDEYVSKEYNKFQQTKVLSISFKQSLSYSIKIKS